MESVQKVHVSDVFMKHCVEFVRLTRSHPAVELGCSPRAGPPGSFGELLVRLGVTAMAFGAPRWVGVVTPIGGLCFLTGWAILAWAARGVDPI